MSPGKYAPSAGEPITVPVERDDNDTAIVTKGVTAGDKVVVNGQYRLDIGSRVDAKTQAPAAGKS